MRIARNTTLHPHASFDWGKPDDICPEFGLRFPPELDVHALRFRDPDGESHVILFSDEGKAKLLKEMTGVEIVRG